MSFLIPVAMFGSIPLIIFWFRKYPPRQAATLSMIVPWMLLPEGQVYHLLGLKGLPVNKGGFVVYTVILCTLLFHRALLRRLRWSRYDVPAALYPVAAFASALANGLGAWEGVAAANVILATYGLPFLVGRIYFGGKEGIREYSTAIFVVCCVSALFVLWEIRMSPQLHANLYGSHSRPFVTGAVSTYGSFRSMLLFPGPLNVGIWLSGGVQIGLWLAATKTVTRIRNVPVMALTAFLLVTLVVQMTKGALILAVIAGLAHLALRWWRFKWFPLVLLIVAAAFAPLRASGVLDADAVSGPLVGVFDADRLQSLRYRLDWEDRLVAHVGDSSLLGLGRIGWLAVEAPEELDDADTETATPDSLWIIAYGTTGWFGLLCVLGMFLYPSFALMRRHSRDAWMARDVGPLLGLTVLATTLWADCLLDSMLIPAFYVLLGALGTAAGRR